MRLSYDIVWVFLCLALLPLAYPPREREEGLISCIPPCQKKTLWQNYLLLCLLTKTTLHQIEHKSLTEYKGAYRRANLPGETQPAALKTTYHGRSFLDKALSASGVGNSLARGQTDLELETP